jgi:multidrug efflux pump subunit AcrA (membrane-fusion protein)
VVDKAEIDLADAMENAESAQTLFDNDVISQNELDSALSAVTTRQSSLDLALQQLEINKSSLAAKPLETSEVTYTEYYESSKKMILSKIAEIDKMITTSYTEAMKNYYDSLIEAQNEAVKLLEKKITDCVVKAPVSGKVRKLDVDSTNMVRQQTPVATITTDTLSNIDVFVSIKYISDIGLGNRVEITENKEGGNRIFGGTIIEIDDRIEATGASLGIEDRTVKVTIKPDMENGISFIPGFAFDVKFFIFSAEELITVPKAAVFNYSSVDTIDDADKNIIWLDPTANNTNTKNTNMVWLVNDGKLVMREIEIGRILRTEYVVTAGLSDADIIIRNARDEGVHHGAKIKI